MKRAILLCLAALASSCSDETKRPSPTPGAHDERVELGGDTAARISRDGVTEVVPLSVVSAVAAHDKIPPAEAVKRLVDDSVVAVVARERGIDQRPPARWLLRAARGRFVADKIRAEAKSGGPPTDDEVKELSLRHWREVDRPPSVRTEHVVVLRNPKGKQGPSYAERARALAARLHDALVSVKNEDFVQRAKSFPKDADLEIVAETLPAVTEEGLSVEAAGTWDSDYVRAAFALKDVGDTSAVVESKFGWHVIRLLEKLPERRMPFESRRIAFAEEALIMRGKKALDARLAPLRAANAVTIAPSAEQLMRSVMSSPSPAPAASGETP